MVMTSHRPRSSRRVTAFLGGILALSYMVATATPAAGVTSPFAPTARELGFRTAFGLTSDVTTVSRATATLAISPNWGVRLTDDEEADLAARVVIAEKLPAVRDVLEADAGFGGLYIDQAAGGIVDVAATSDRAAAIQSALANLAPAGARTRVRIVSNSLASLGTLKETISDEMTARTPLGVNVYLVRVDIPANLVRVGVDRSNYETTVTNLEDRFPGAPLAVEPSDPPIAAACTGRLNCSPPMRAGVKITDPAGCTSNFMATAGAINYVLTAGHCGAVGNNFKHNGASIGVADKTAFKNGGFADALRIKLNNANLKSNLLYVTLTTQRPITSVMPLNGDVVGSPVCASGYVTEFFCGAVTDVDADGLYSENNFVIKHMQIASIQVRLGDSGGPVFYGNKAMGVIGLVNGTHHDPPDEHWDALMFSQVRDEEIQLGVTVNTH